MIFDRNLTRTLNIAALVALLVVMLADVVTSLVASAAGLTELNPVLTALTAAGLPFPVALAAPKVLIAALAGVLVDRWGDKPWPLWFITPTALAHLVAAIWNLSAVV